MRQVKLIRMNVERSPSGLLCATSPDLRGLVVAGRTLEALERAVPQAITDMFFAMDEEVIVARSRKAHDDVVAPWVIIPAEMADASLGATALSPTAG